MTRICTRYTHDVEETFFSSSMII